VDGLADSPLDSRNRNYDGALGFHDQHSSAYWRDGSGFHGLCYVAGFWHDSQRTSRTDHAGPAAPLRSGALRRLQGHRMVPQQWWFGGTVYVGSDAGLISMRPSGGSDEDLLANPRLECLRGSDSFDGTIHRGARTTGRDLARAWNRFCTQSRRESGMELTLSVTSTTRWQLARMRLSTCLLIMPIVRDQLDGQSEVDETCLRELRRGGPCQGRYSTRRRSRSAAYHPDGQSAWSIPVWVDNQLVVHDTGRYLQWYQCRSNVGYCIQY